MAMTLAMNPTIIDTCAPSSVFISTERPSASVPERVLRAGGGCACRSCRLVFQFEKMKGLMMAISA